MIDYKFAEESEYAQHYAQKLNDTLSLEILKNGSVSSSEEATHISVFFWKMVDESIEEEKVSNPYRWDEGAEFWNEKLMNSISGYLERAGYEDEWDQVVDQQ